MLTKNFYSAVAAMFTKNTVTNGIVSYDGTTRNAAYYQTLTGLFALDYMHKLRTTALAHGIGEQGVRIGSGATPATADDYTLENLILSGISIVNPSGVSVSAEKDGVSATATYAVANTGNTAIEINEIGLYGEVFTNNSSTHLALLDRTVLESPITINPGESKTLTYTIRFNYPVE